MLACRIRSSRLRARWLAKMRVVHLPELALLARRAARPGARAAPSAWKSSGLCLKTQRTLSPVGLRHLLHASGCRGAERTLEVGELDDRHRRIGRAARRARRSDRACRASAAAVRATAAPLSTVLHEGHHCGATARRPPLAVDEQGRCPVDSKPRASGHVTLDRGAVRARRERLAERGDVESSFSARACAVNCASSSSRWLANSASCISQNLPCRPPRRRLVRQRRPLVGGHPGCA